jgi:L-ribulokinase
MKRLGARNQIDRPIFQCRGLGWSGLSQNNVFLMQLMADILGRDIKVPLIPHVTAVSAAIHGAVAAGVVADYTESASRWSAKDRLRYCPRPEAIMPYQALYKQCCKFSQNAVVRTSMHELNHVAQIRDETAHS